MCIQRLFLTIRSELLIHVSLDAAQDTPIQVSADGFLKGLPTPKLMLLQESDTSSPNENSNGFLGVHSRFS